MVETFRSQWAELEEEYTAKSAASHSRYRGVHRTWEHHEPASEDEKENEAYVEELKEDIEETHPHKQRPTLAQYRQQAKAKAPATKEVTATKKAVKEEPEKATKKPAAKSGGRKLLFRRKSSS
jgi:hypothetical protein